MFSCIFLLLYDAYENFKLGGGVTTCPMTFSQGLSSWNHSTPCWVLGLVMIGMQAILLPTKPPYYLHKGNH